MRRTIVTSLCLAVVLTIGFGLRNDIPAAWQPAWLFNTGSAAEPGSTGLGKGHSPVSVTVATALAGDMPIRRSTIGWITSVAATTLTTQQQGIVVSIAARNGQDVKAGDKLVQLDDRAAQATLARDQAALARDQATAVSAHSELQRAQDLAQRQFASAEVLDQAVAAAGSADAVIAIDQANIAAAQVVVDDLLIEAPHAGRLGAFEITVGSLVQPGTPIVTLTDIDNIEADFTVSDADVGLLRSSLKTGAVPVRISAANRAGAPATAPADASVVEGKVDFIDSAINEGSGTLAVRASVPNADHLFWPGQAVRVEIDLGAERNTVIVPVAAVRQGQAGSNVFVVKPDMTIEVRSVEVAGIVDGNAAIRTGLRAGDIVVTEGQMSLNAGTSVAVRASGPAEAGS